jgi:tetratricopeptide (TPR) repeat protein
MFKSLLPLLFLLVAIPDVNARPQNVTDEEIALTSPFCLDTEAFRGGHQCQIGRTQKSYYWQEVLGNGFCHLHHYCWAEVHLLRANKMSTPAVERKRQFGYAANEFNYVIKNSPPDFILLPEVFTRKGEAELRIDDFINANKSFAKARALKPDYWPAYTGWIEALIRAGRKEDAKALAKRGLEYSPKARLLIEQYKRLGGDPQEIVPKSEPENLPPAAQAEQKSE